MHSARALAFLIVLLCCTELHAGERAGSDLKILIDAHSVRINGVELRSGPRAADSRFLSLDAAKKVLGAPQDEYLAGLGVTVFAWTDIGIHLQRGFRGADAGKLFKFQVWLESVSDQEHKQSGKFTGHLRVEGVDILSNSTFDSLRPALESAGFQVTKYPYIVEAAKGQIRIFTVDTTNRLERIEVWCP